MYHLLRQILFWFPPEQAHYISMDLLKTGCSISFIKKIIENQFAFQEESLGKNLFGLHFKNPVGLGAGFDKNALYLKELEALGFGFVEIGTVTPKAQDGNPKPRLFRLPKDKALINRMGFNNNGVEVIKKQLEGRNNLKHQTLNLNPLIVGGNIGKNKATENADAWRDYNICFNELFDVVDYFVVNVSSPNTPGLRELQDKEMLRKILLELQNINQSKKQAKPLLLKIAPDLTQTQLDDIVALTNEINLDGLVVANTTISRENLITSQSEVDKIANGGLSGKPLKTKSDEVLSYINQQIPKTPIIGSGGIFTGQDAKDKMNAGASLVQVWTGFVYEGPSIVKNICEALKK
jgi:dihydroorotate dehydrogenase